MKKYADTSKIEVVTPKGHAEIEKNLHAKGVKSAQDLTSSERTAALDIKE